MTPRCIPDPTGTRTLRRMLTTACLARAARDPWARLVKASGAQAW